MILTSRALIFTSAQIRYQLPISDNVELAIYTTVGERIATLVNEEQSQGTYNIIWNGTDAKGAKAPSGTYICKLSVDGLQTTQKMVHIK